MNKAVLAVAIALVVLATGFVAGVLNLEAKNRAVNGAWREVAASYRERAALLPGYLLSVKRHIPRDAAIVGLVEHGALRASQRLADTPPATIRSFEQMIDTQAELTQAMAQLTAASERYPSLQADPEFVKLNAKMTVIEEKITKEWRSYNQVAHSFNLFKRSLIARFANSVICKYDGKILFGEEEGAGVVLGAAG